MRPDQASTRAPAKPAGDEVLQLVAPNGPRIIGTLEKLTGRSNALGFTRAADGTFRPEYTGCTEVFWDDQETVFTHTREMVVLDRDGNEWPISACRVEGKAEDGEGV